MGIQEALPVRLGPYRLLDRIGEGGMGVVHLAADPECHQVAIKVLRPHVAGDATARRRLAREVEMMRRVRSPFVAEVIDADVTGNVPYVVTRFVPGRTLDEVVHAGGPLRGAQLQRLASGLACALAAIHAAGVVHRDLKPGNVMMVGDDPVVIDFGIAQAADATRITATGMFIGTPGYLAPEVIEGQPGGPAADVHSWGATVAFAARGQPPYGTGSYEAVFFRILQGSANLDGIGGGLQRLVAAALQRDPAKRPTPTWLANYVARLDLADLGAAAGVMAQASATPAAATSAAPTAAAPTAAPPAAAPAVGPASSGNGAPAAGIPVNGAPAAGAAAAASAAVASAAAANGANANGVAANGAALIGAAASGAAPNGRRDGAQVPNAQVLTGVRNGQPAAAVRNGQAAAQVAYQRPRDVADLLPPVRYAPPPKGGQNRPAHGNGAGQQAARAAARPRRVGRHRLMGLAALLTAIGISLILPVAGTVTVLALIAILRAADRAQSGLALRRSVRGPRAVDPLLIALSAPWALARSVVVTILLAPLLLFVSVIVAAGMILFMGHAQMPVAASFGAGVFMALNCLGPGSRAPRRQLNRMFNVIAPNRLAGAAATIVLGSFAATMISLATLKAPAFWPATDPLNLLSHLPGANLFSGSIARLHRIHGGVIRGGMLRHLAHRLSGG